MKRHIESGWAILRKSKMHGAVYFRHPLYLTREAALADMRGAYAKYNGTQRVVKIRVTELTPKLKKKIKISLARGARRAK